jgi:glycosyltransferase involved in cell wall biosynthesis
MRLFARRARPEPAAGRPFRIGIWGHYGAPLIPAEGGTVFLLNLIRGLMALPEPLQVVLLALPQSQELVRPVLGPPSDRFELIPAPVVPPRRSLGQRLLAVWIGVSDCYHGLAGRFANRISATRQRIKHWLKTGARPLVHRARRRNWAAVLFLALLAPMAFGLIWLAYAGYKFMLAGIQVLGLPLRWTDRALRRLYTPPPPVPPVDLAEAARQAACDVWIYPTIHCMGPPLSDFPSVLFIHDLVTSHFPEGFSSEFLERVNQAVRLRVKQATLCVCMSAFIRDSDLLGVLGLSPAKVRMVRFAPPEDFPVLTEEELKRLKPAGLSRPYLLLPNAFRPYKGHDKLIEALHLLRDKYQLDDFDLVFTRHNPDDVPERLREPIERWGLQDRVHIVGCVPRETLAALYHGAFATILPTRYEQGSFQIYEALRWNCPVACSRIPPLVEQCAPMGDAMLYFDPDDAGDLARTILRIQADRETIRERQQATQPRVFQRTWKDAAAEWLPVFKEAAERWAVEPMLDLTMLEPWPEACSARPRQRRGIFLFLQQFYLGGVWQSCKNLIHDLVLVNRRRRQFDFTLGVLDQQSDFGIIEDLQARGDVELVRMRVNPIGRAECASLLGGAIEGLRQRQESAFCFFSGAAAPALAADAWFGFTDRFTLPLLPARPYGLIVHDVIQLKQPDCFHESFFRAMTRGIAPTLRHASRVVVTTPQTHGDVVAAYGLEAQRIRLVPLSWNPALRFGACQAQRRLALDRPYLLNVANASPHKGSQVLVRAFARLKERLGTRCPPLVVCGVFTDRFSADLPEPHNPAWKETRALVRELALQEKSEIFFLGFVSDAELLDLYERSGVVINAALYDNGSYSLTEAAYFGKPAITSDYPAARYLCERFQVPASFFPPGDSAALAAAIEVALQEPPRSAAAIDRARRRYDDPEYSSLRFAERVYDVLLELAGQEARSAAA